MFSLLSHNEKETRTALKDNESGLEILSQRLIEKLYIKILASSKPQLIPVFVIVTFFSFLVALFLIIFEFAKAILAIIN